MGSSIMEGIYRLHRAVSGILRDCNGCQHSGRSLWLSGHVLHNALLSYDATVFSTIAEQFGIMAGDLAYIGAIIMGAFILHLIYRRYHR